MDWRQVENSTVRYSTNIEKERKQEAYQERMQDLKDTLKDEYAKFDKLQDRIAELENEKRELELETI